MKRIVGALVLAVSFLVLGLVGPASAETIEDQLDCHPPQCYVQDGDPFDASSDGGVGVVLALALIAGVVVLGITAYKVSMARDIARRSGMDPDKAAAMTLLSDDGLDATYLAANLRDRDPSDVQQAAPARTPRERLRDLTELKAQGLVSEDEYAQRRAAILDSI
ncbi:SHOCT domain-containing protein [Mumia zhuanghuii]|uniref:SHOCT domain-containing protein n=2 Tax=Mumia TaxID=1546255 RepID=A0ABW1QJN9_9ACTN|nr:MULTISPECIES: SHOCT domain-containing protein [Mumia]KAA1418306.1 SHOCT domain-containing protein [Mumia zhuanghuii]